MGPRKLARVEMFLDPFGRPRCHGVIAGPKLHGGTSTDSTDCADEDTETR